jgi:hypothetical protein
LNFSIAYGKTAFGLAKDFGARAETNNKTHAKKTRRFSLCASLPFYSSKRSAVHLPRQARDERITRA